MMDGLAGRAARITLGANKGYQEARFIAGLAAAACGAARGRVCRAVPAMAQLAALGREKRSRI